MHGGQLHDLTNVSLVQTAEEVLSLEQKVVNTAILSDPERFSEIPYNMEDASKTNDCPHNAVAGAKVLCSFYLSSSLCYAATSCYIYGKNWYLLFPASYCLSKRAK